MKKSRLIFILLISCMMLFTTACGKGNVANKIEEKPGTVVFKYGDNIVTKGEVYVYICTVKEQYELKYGDDVWQLTLPQNNDNVSMVNLTKEEVIKSIIKVKTLISHQEKYNISLTDGELNDIKQGAASFFKGLTDEQISSMELTNDLIEKVLTENAIANKVQDKLLEKNPVEVSEEQARVTTFFDMYFPCYNIDSSGNIVPFSAEEREKQHDNALQACSTLATSKIDGNKDLESIQKLAEYYKLKQAKTQTMTPDEILETYGEEIYNTLYAMENNDYSTVIESEYGYHVFQMIALTDRDATNKRKEDLYDDVVEKVLAETLDKWKQDIDPKFSYEDSVDMDVYDTIKISE